MKKCPSSAPDLLQIQCCQTLEMMFWCRLFQQPPECTSWRGTRVRSPGRRSRQWEEIPWATCSRCWWDENRNTNRFVSRRHIYLYVCVCLRALALAQSGVFNYFIQIHWCGIAYNYWQDITNPPRSRKIQFALMGRCARGSKLAHMRVKTLTPGCKFAHGRVKSKDALPLARAPSHRETLRREIEGDLRCRRYLPRGTEGFLMRITTQNQLGGWGKKKDFVWKYGIGWLASGANEWIKRHLSSWLFQFNITELGDGQRGDVLILASGWNGSCVDKWDVALRAHKSAVHTNQWRCFSAPLSGRVCFHSTVTSECKSYVHVPCRLFEGLKAKLMSSTPVGFCRKACCISVAFQKQLGLRLTHA